MKKSLLVILALLVCSTIQAQHREGTDFTIGPFVKTNGYGIGSSAILKKSETLDHGLSLQISTLKHSRETRVQNDMIISPKTYFFGKQYRAFQVNPSYQILLKEGVSGRNAASLKYGLEIGPSFAFLRPVYLVVMDFDQNENLRPIVEPYDPIKHDNQEEILGDAGWERGFSELSMKAGIHIGAFLNMGWDQNHFRKRLQTGLAMDMYFQDLGIIYKNKNQVFGSIFITYQIGKNR